MVLSTTYKTNLEPIDKGQRRIFRAIFYRRQWDTLQGVYKKRTVFNVYEMFIVDVVKDGFKQLHLESPSEYLDTSLAGHDYNTSGKY